MRNDQRRRFLLASGTLLTALPALIAAGAFAVPAYAQKTKIHRVAFIATLTPVQELPSNSAVRAFVGRLRELGYVEGRNLVIDLRSLEGRYERSSELLADIVRLKPDVIFSASQVILERSPGATGNIPVVTLASWSIVESGLAKSLARPGGTITGQLYDIESGIEAKRLQLLRELVPQAKRVAFLAHSGTWDDPEGKQVRAAAQRLGVTLVNAAYKGTDIQAAFAAIDREAPDAVFVAAGPMNYGNRQKISDFVSARRLPCSAGIREIAEYGCLMSCGVDVGDMMRRAAGSAAKILAGAKPGDLPSQPDVATLRDRFPFMPEISRQELDPRHTLDVLGPNSIRVNNYYKSAHLSCLPSCHLHSPASFVRLARALRGMDAGP